MNKIKLTRVVITMLTTSALLACAALPPADGFDEEFKEPTPTELREIHRQEMVRGFNDEHYPWRIDPAEGHIHYSHTSTPRHNKHTRK